MRQCRTSSRPASVSAQPVASNGGSSPAPPAAGRHSLPHVAARRPRRQFARPRVDQVGQALQGSPAPPRQRWSRSPGPDSMTQREHPEGRCESSLNRGRGRNSRRNSSTSCRKCRREWRAPWSSRSARLTFPGGHTSRGRTRLLHETNSDRAVG